ncbi:hypothetical protein BSB_32290 [Bacillus stercoris]|nr:hypothetical protein BSB_32290 [Bacillus stercoris]
MQTFLAPAFILLLSISYIDVQTVLSFLKTSRLNTSEEFCHLFFLIVEPLSAAVYTGLLVFMDADYICLSV